jgi:serine/threonine protein kinase/DNA-binding winged helix-turn-helix (wHTH) protein
VDSHLPNGRAQRVSGQVWKFADYDFDELRRELRVRGAVVNLETKPWEVLHQLLLHAGEVVTKEELLDAVWPGLTVVDASLATAVSKVRKAIGDDSVIVTIPRVGYRLGVPVKTTFTPAPDSHELHLSEGETVPRRDQWRLVRRLDHSAASEVWLAEHPKTHETRVFKFALGQSGLRSLKREVTLARLLRDSLGERREFVRLFEWNFETPPYFVESEYAGPNLKDWAESKGGLHAIPPEQRLEILATVASAVAEAHELGVFHKDLKPGNILIANDSDGAPQIKIADFGSATLLLPSRLAELGITNLGFTHTQDNGSLSGTVMYIAPEVLGGLSPTAASDVYALGVLLHQLVVGDFRKPLAPGWESDVADPLLREDIAEAACGDPARRMKSAAEFAERLRTLDHRRAERDERVRAEERAQSAARRRAKLRGRLIWVALAAVLVVISVAALRSFRKGSPNTATQPAAPHVKTVAVLPFQNVGSDHSIDYLRLALADEVATILSHMSGVVVRPFAATSKYDQPDLDLQKAGQETHVSSVVTGHFMKEGEQLRITLEAVDVETNRVLWQDKVESLARSPIATQAQIALRLNMGLLPAFGASAPPASAAPDTTRPKIDEAYELYLRGTALAFDLNTIEQAIHLLERAVQVDPGYAQAWSALSVAYSREAHYTRHGRGSLERSDAANERALALDPHNVNALITRTSNHVERGNLVQAYQEAKELIRAYPDRPGAHAVLTYALRYAGLLDEAARECDAAFSLNTQNPSFSLRSCAMVFVLKGEYARATNFLSNYGNQLSGSDYATALSIGMLVRQGKEQQALQLGSAYTPQWAGYDLLLACAKRKPAAEVRALAGPLEPSEDPEMNYVMAGHLAYCGQSDAALEMLRRAIKGKYCSYPAIDSDPLLASLRAKPEFAEIRSAAIQCQKNFLAQRDQPLK